MSDTDERISRDFLARDSEEQADFLHNTWCNLCQQIDLGMVNPIEYELLGRVFIEGQCAACGEPSITELVEADEDEEGEDQEEGESIDLDEDLSE
jgi:hypothetical protein